MAILTSELQSATPSSVIELFMLELNELQHGVNSTYRFHAGANLNSNGELVWAGNTYIRLPVDADGFEYNGNGQLPRPKLVVSNILGTITAILLTLPNGLEGAKITRIRTLARYLDAVNFSGGTNPYGTPDPTAEFPREIFYIDRKSIETRDIIEFELAAAFDLQGVRIPKRQCISNICQWVYRSAECGYMDNIYYSSDDAITLNASEDACGKRVSSCESRFGPIIRTGSVVNGSTILTLDSTAGIQAGANGYPIKGPGVPAGTIVSSISSSTTLVMSAAATSSTSVTVNGTVSTSNNTMTVASATGLMIGQSVSGTYVLPGTTISNILGTTITLSQRPASIYRKGVVGSFGTVNPTVVYLDVNDLSVGMKVFGSNGVDTTISTVTSEFITLASAPAEWDFDSKVVLYFIPSSVSQASYAMLSSNTYKFRSENTVLPFGSFPGVGQFI